MSDIKTRLITGIIAFCILAFFVTSGGWLFRLAILFIALGLCHELSAAFKFKGYYIPEFYILLGCALHYIAFLFDLPSVAGLCLSATLILIDFLRKQDFGLRDLSACFLILVYIPFFLFPITRLGGAMYLYLVFIIAFSTDICAYLAGSTLGKHKLLPQVSPKKTIEGSLGGILGAVLLSSLFFIFKRVELSFLHILFFGIASVAGQLGDLFASKIKRQTGIKDFGKILPGHGGLLDRFDSILLIIPMVYILYWTHL